MKVTAEVERPCQAAGDVTADHGAAGGPCRSRPGDEVRRAPARRPRKTLHREREEEEAAGALHREREEEEAAGALRAT